MIFDNNLIKPFAGTSKSQDNIRPLKTKYRKNGFDYTIVRRGQRSFIYCQHVTDQVKYNEVFYRRVAPQWTIDDNIIPARESFPNDEAFGVWAWSFRSDKRAIEKFKELEDEK